jgi:hypothetical protein
MGHKELALVDAAKIHFREGLGSVFHFLRKAAARLKVYIRLEELFDFNVSAQSDFLEVETIETVIAPVCIPLVFWG